MMKRLLIASGLWVGLIFGMRAQVVPINGDFEKGDSAGPRKALLWDKTDGLAAQWTDAPKISGAPPHGKAIRMDTAQSEQAVVTSYRTAGMPQWVFPNPKENAIAETYGISLYSEALPIVAGKTYKVTFDYLAEKGTAGKLWFRAYADVNGQKKRAYEGTIDCGGKAGQWQHLSGVFHPTKYNPKVTEFKIMLFAYYPAGVAWFDNVHVEAVEEPVEEAQ